MKRRYQTGFTNQTGSRQFDLIVSVKADPYKFVNVPSVDSYEASLLAYNFEDRAKGELAIRKKLNLPSGNILDYTLASRRLFYTPFKCDIYVTNRFHEATGNPLFFKHEIPAGATDISVFEIVNGAEKATVRGAYDFQDGTLFHNLWNKFNYQTQEFSMFVVRYKIAGFDELRALRRDLVFTEAENTYQYYTDDDLVYFVDYNNSGSKILIRYNPAISGNYAACQSMETTYDILGSLNPSLHSNWGISINSFTRIN